MDTILVGNNCRLKLPSSDWQYEVADKVLSVYNSTELHGIIQISSFETRDELFLVDVELERELKRGNYFNKVVVAGYDALYLKNESTENGVLDYYWIIGFNRVKLFITAYVSIFQTEEKKAYDLELIKRIISTIEINNVS